VTSSFTLVNDVISSATSSFTIRNSTGTNIFSIDQFGAVSINGDLSVAGKLYPSARGSFQHDYYIYLDDTLGASSTYMSTNADGWQADSAYDLAERYESNQGLEPGDVVMVDTADDIAITKAVGSDKPYMGIVSTRPGFVLGKHATSTYPVALVGRVPTKVSDMNGPIAIGDQLTVSTENPGVAVKATNSGYVIGIALEAFPGGNDNLIEVFVQPGWNGTAVSTGASTALRGFADAVTGATKVTITFASLGAYPNIQVTPYGGVTGGWYLNNVTDVGFEIVLNQIQSHDVRFAWTVERTQSGEQVYYSDNTYGPIDPLTGIGPGGGTSLSSTDSGTGSGTSTDPGTDPGSGSSTDPGTP